MDTFCRSFDEAPHTAGALNSHETPDTGDAGHTAGTAPRTWVGSWLCTWHTGPDAGGTHRLGVGRHLVGRAHTATVRCDDPALQPHHALLEVRADGALTLTQLTGRAPVLVDGAPLTGSTTALASVRLAVGNSTITCSRADDDGSVAPAAQVVHGAHPQPAHFPRTSHPNSHRRHRPTPTITRPAALLPRSSVWRAPVRSQW